MDISDFNNKGKKPMNINNLKSYNTQHIPKNTKSPNTQIYSPQPFSPLSYNSQTNSPQPFTPLSYNSASYSQSFSPLHPSRPNTPKRPKTPNQFSPRSLNNSPFDITTNSSVSSPMNSNIHHSNSTSKLYIRNNNHIPMTMISNINNPNSLCPPSYPYNNGKHSNKKQAVHTVYQHARKVVNDDNNEAVEISEVTQQLYKVKGSDMQHGETSLYSFTTYTSNDKKKIKHTHSNIEIHSFLSDNSSDGSDSITSPLVNMKNNLSPYGDNNNHVKPYINCIPSQGSLEENDHKDCDEDDTPKIYNIPLNDTINTTTYHRKCSSDYGRNNTENYNRPNNIQNKNKNSTRKNSLPYNESISINHRKHSSDYGRYCNTGNNYPTEYDNNSISIVVRNPNNNIISPTSDFSEESYREDYNNIESPSGSYSVFSTTYQKKSNIKDDPYINDEDNTSNFSLHQSQASTLNSIMVSQNTSYDQDAEIINVDESQIYKVNNRNRKKHKTTTTTTTTYEIIEDIDDDDDDDDDDEDDNNNNDKDSDSKNEEVNQRTVEKYVRFSNFPFQYRRQTPPRGLLTGPSENEVITDKSTLSYQINLRKSSWHTSFFENRGRQPSSSMFSIPRYQPEKPSNLDNFEDDESFDSLEDINCYHILYQFDKEDFIVRLGKALYLYGSPTFRTECTLRSVSKLLGLQGEFASFPTLILLSFSNYNNNETLNSESHLLLTPTGYNLGKLEEVVQITYELKLAIREIQSKFNKNKGDKETKQKDEKSDKKSKRKSNKKDKQKGKKDKKEDDQDSVVIDIEKSNSISDIHHISRNGQSSSNNDIENEKVYEENDITVYSVDDIQDKEEGFRHEDKEKEESGNEDNYLSSRIKDKIQNIDNDSNISLEKCEKEVLTSAINKLDYVIGKPPSFGSVFWQFFSYVVAAATASPILFGGTWLDSIVSGFVGLIVGIITYYEPLFFTSHSHLVELLASLGASATLRIIQGIFPKYCVNFTADILSAVLYLLPGLNFTIGFIELASRNMISGTVRLIHSLVTSFMMGAGITIGVHMTKFITVPIVLDSSTTQTCQIVASPSTYWYILMFPLLGISLNMMFYANASQFPIMVFTTLISYIITLIGNKFELPNEVSIIIAALAVGIVSNVYAKLRKKLAIIPIIIGVLLLVPGSVGVKGSLAFLIDQNFETGIQFTISMFTVSMWITIGVFLSNLIVFPFKNPEHMGLMTL
ncbi:hypothetical protein BCR36DRAFT_363868 [Piromyces finnis]|uniref:Threonine/serine exporter-like N-terminal domain-containing protein n=1 Tax=Piromyces finnis TaxID=1754191 RepID=A0A1Y1UVK5_9FUNG|nr:hypothetical protein BCR36DRAFT_363868 [Piromyces finnis]|eukprot:ORX41640.1 hypothetical protein BCR36DRAFT_363868 [Piromyces finnis]